MFGVYRNKQYKGDTEWFKVDFRLERCEVEAKYDYHDRYFHEKRKTYIFKSIESQRQVAKLERLWPIRFRWHAQLVALIDPWKAPTSPKWSTLS